MSITNMGFIISFIIEQNIFFDFRTGTNASAPRLQNYTGTHDMWTDGMPDPYDEFYEDRYVSPNFTWLVVISTGPYMFLEFVANGSAISTGFKLSLNIRPAGGCVHVYQMPRPILQFNKNMVLK